MSRIGNYLATMCLWLLVLLAPAARAQVVEYVHTDALGSPVAITNEAGQVIERSDYEPYGSMIGKANNDRPGYTGHVMDSATGLTYMQQRYYDPTIGRFLSVDPVQANATTGASFNRYNYANNTPYKFTDPDGRCTAAANATKDTPTTTICHPVSELGLSEKGTKHIQIAEGGFRKTVYDDNGKAKGGYLTVGYGHKLTKADGLKEGDTINAARGDSLFKRDSSEVEASLRTAAGKTQLSQQEWDGLVDLGFNAGKDVYSAAKSPLLNDALRRADYGAMAGQLKYTQGPQGTRDGLIRRSNERQEIFVNGKYPED